MTPIGHIGIALPMGRVVGLRLPVMAVSALLPDIVDQPLWALGIGSGHYIAHTLLFGFVLFGLLFFWKPIYGVSALLGVLSHLLLDAVEGDSIPWFYPMAPSHFPDPRHYPGGFMENLSGLVKSDFSASHIGTELLLVSAALMLAGLCLWFRRTLRERRGRAP